MEKKQASQASQDSKAPGERWLNMLERVLPLLLMISVPVAGGVWAVYVYTQNQADVAAKQAIELNSQTRARLIELQKPFIDQQFNTFNDVIKTIGEILLYAYARGEWDKPERSFWTDAREAWEQAEASFWTLYWSRLALVEDEEIHIAKKRFGNLLSDFKKEMIRESVLLSRTPRDHDAMEANRQQLDLLQKHLQEASIPLTTALRKGIKKSWTGELGQ